MTLEPGQSQAITLSAENPDSLGAIVARKSGTRLDVLFGNDSKLVVDHFFDGTGRDTLQLPAPRGSTKGKTITTADTGYALGNDMSLLHASGGPQEIEKLLSQGAFVVQAPAESGLMSPEPVRPATDYADPRDRYDPSDDEGAWFTSWGIVPLSLTAAGDVNGDGLADLMVGAPGAAVGGLETGRVYVILGSTVGVFSQVNVDLMGSVSDDEIFGTSDSETIAGGRGNDTVVANGAADVIDGGSGNDVLIINAAVVAALSTPFGGGSNVEQLAMIDGGNGIDTLQLDGAGILLDLTAIGSKGAGLPDSQSRLESIEIIQLQGNGTNSLVLTVGDVLDLSGFNSFNNLNGWVDGSYDLGVDGNGGSGVAQYHQLVIQGNAGDSVSSSGWTSLGTVAFAGDTYNVYSSGLAQLLVQDGITTSVV